ncbi:MAG: exported protein of unknown function [Candidatus Acidoferrum typicum]|nr:exported protein of unknown function [Candidatus Acidoferrum typicum]
MNRTGRFRSVCVSVYAAAALLVASGAHAQQHVAPAAVAPRKAALKKFVDATNQLSPEVRKHLSHGLQTYLHYANAVVNGTATKPIADAAHKTPWASGASFAGGAIAVSNPALDPSSQGYTQNTTSSAWCGNSIVVGYQDTGAFLRTDPNAAFGVPNSFDGISYSADAGKNFKDLGALTPGTFSANALIGDPIVTCSSPAHFQYASILNTMASDGITPLIGPSVSFSTDGGKTWSEPLQVVSLDGSTEVADNPSLAVDPANPRHMYLTYTHASALACTNVEMVRSTDGGKTWSAPAAINSDCNNPNILMNTGSSLVVSPGGKIYVAYESFPVPPAGTSFGKTAIFFVRSLDGGATFGKPVKISDVTPAGDGVYLNGPLQANDYPQLAVDRTNHSSRGTVYITWPDGRNHVVPERNAPSGTYAYADVFVAKSTNFGASFKVLGAISPTPKDFRGVGRDQFLPAIAVDNDSEVAVCYYDRRNDRANLRVDRFCSISANQGKTWKDQEVSVLNWLPTPNTDPISGGATAVISEYDGLTSEFLLHGDGFFGAFIIEISGNQNVVATKF